ncbi:hypothetical protein GGH99_001109 [Coemansia sp. RSA 1285]|nr:hypothetical protein EV177_000924 [Coemansia sp. RSA 1804]KAJ2693536.1 hypothetical protein GGH99_001109 [Coemansia sp. RSA 1285]
MLSGIRTAATRTARRMPALSPQQRYTCLLRRRAGEGEHECTRRGIATTAVARGGEEKTNSKSKTKRPTAAKHRRRRGRREEGELLSSQHISALGKHHTSEPPLVVQSKSAPFTAEEVDRAIGRLRRKLRRFLLHNRSAATLEALWELYQTVLGSAEDWQLSKAEAMQFLAAILRASDRGDVWCGRAQTIASTVDTTADAALRAAVALALARIYARFGDLAGLESAVAGIAHGGDEEVMKMMEQDDYHETRAIALARAGLPQQAEEALELAGGATLTPEACERFRHNIEQTKSKRGPRIWMRLEPAGVEALRNILAAWARSRGVDRAWATMDRLLTLGYAESSREWNALLHMHALDPRYRYELLEHVLERMRNAGAKRDHATYNIIMQGCLLRGLQPQWRSWLVRMQDAGFSPDVYTYATPAAQLAATGQWSEAHRVVEAMKRTATAAPARAISANAAMRIERQRNRSAPIMDRFRANVFFGRAITAEEFAGVAAVALDCPARWPTEIALLVRCLEEGCVADSAVISSLAARLPGIDDRLVGDRPLLRMLRSLSRSADAGSAIVESVGAGSNSDAMRQLGGGRRRVPGALDAIVQRLLRGGAVAQAERLLHAARDASVGVGSSATLLSVLHHMLRQPSASGGIVARAAEELAAARFLPPTHVPAALLAACVKSGDMEAAREHFVRLERLVEQHPSLRAFNALLYYAQTRGDALTLELKWRQMESLGLAPDAIAHRTRIVCYSLKDDMLRTRRAYADMLDYGYPPTASVVAPMVRCCIRCNEIDLALIVIRHAEKEHGAALSTTAYNYVISRIASLPEQERLACAMFDAMLSSPDARLLSDMSDVISSVTARKLRFADLRVFGARSQRQNNLAAWLLRPEKEKELPTRSMKLALAQWLTSQAAFSAAPTLFNPRAKRDQVDMADGAHDKLRAARLYPIQEPGSKHKLSDALPTTPPPPNATTFIIMMRTHGQHKRWESVIASWNALHTFNRRIDALETEHPQVARHRVQPFGRMISWVALALVELGRRSDALRIWNAAAAEGVISDAAVVAGMDQMLVRLPHPRRMQHERSPTSDKVDRTGLD